jgi:DNA-binding beta-propeller fold protein YncE
MKARLLFALLFMAAIAFGAMSVHSLIPDDADGDGVPDSVDVCPAEDASGFDRDGDGCLDADRGARHVEYWGSADGTVTYLINEDGSPDIGDGSEFTAIQAAFAAWPAVVGTELNIVYGGTTPTAIADAVDQVNTVTFTDNTYPFSAVVLAVGLSTSFTVDSLYNARRYRAGEIVDADMIFNPGKAFKTATSGPPYGTDIQGVATHEAGHMWGISHTAIRSATMSYVLPAGTAARSLESDDQLIYFKAYADSTARANANRITGTVVDGQTSNPVPGAIVFVISAATGDTTACEYTLPDGSYSVIGMPDGEYYVSIYPLNGTSPISFIQPGNINALVEATAVDLFVPEYWDMAESNSDDSAAKTAITVGGGSTALVDLITNIDATAPFVVSATPPDDSVGVAIDGAFVIRFSEAVNTGTLAANFDFTRVPDGAGVGGNLAVLRDDSLIAFTPSTPLDFDTQYQLTLSTGLTDAFGNPLAAPYVLDVTTETAPPLSISSLSPNKGVVNTTVVINGRGFDTSPPATVTFDGVAATVSEAFPNKLVVTVPAGADTGPVIVTNPSDYSVSNDLTFTLLSDVEIARGYETGVVTLTSAPTSITLTPDDSYAYVGTAAGAEAVIVDPAASGYLTSEGIPYPGGFDGMATTPEGRRVYAVSRFNQELVEIMADSSSGLLFNTVLSSHDIGADPFGIAIGSTGRRAYIPTEEAEIQVWDTQLGSATYQQQVGVMYSPDGESLRGQMALTPDGNFLLALTDFGDLLVYELGPDTLLQTVNVGLDPRDVIVDAIGDHVYVSHDGGDISVVALRFLASPSFEVTDIVAGGALRGMDITPAGSYIYATDRQLDQGKIVDLQEVNPTFRTVVADYPLEYNPIALELSSDGVYGFSLLQGYQTTSPRLVVTTIGLGPALRTVYPRAARPGDTVVLAGAELGDIYMTINVDFNGAIALPTDIYSGEKLVVKVPEGAATGPVKVTTISDAPPHEARTSNEVYFTVLGPSSTGGLRFAGNVPLDAGFSAGGAVEISPRGDLAFVGGSDGTVSIFSIDPSSPDFHQQIHSVDVTGGYPIDDLAVTPDGRFLFVASVYSNPVPIISVLRSAGNFGAIVDSLDLDPGTNPQRVAITPDGQFTLVYDAGFGVHIADNQPDAQAGTIAPVRIDTVFAPDMVDMVIHPSGQRAYLGIAFPPAIQVVSLETRGVDFGLIIDTEPMPADFALPQFQPFGLGITPDGTMLLVNAFNDVFGHELIEFNTPIPSNPLPGDTISVSGSWLLGAISGIAFAYQPLMVSPRGDQAIWSMYNFGMNYYPLGEDPAIIYSQGGYDESLQPYDFSFTPDGNRVYMASETFDSLRVYDFAAAQNLTKISGDNQNGVAGQTLPAPLRVKVGAIDGGSIEGVALEFSTANGGFVTTSGVKSSIVLATDASGYAQATWQFDGATGAKTATVSAPGLGGSPLTFNATAVVDPATLPLQLSQVIPINDTPGISVTTAVQATFSRGVKRSSVTPASLQMKQIGGDPVDYAVGYTDDDRKVSLTPLLPLQYAAGYEIVFDSTLQDTSGGFLENPSVSAFATQAAPPPPAITAINPPSGLNGVYVTISGNGFDPVPGNNAVNFAGADPAIPIAGSVDYLKVKVPGTAITGNVTVTTPTATSNSKPFTVLVPNTSPIDDVIATLGVGGGTKSLAVTPDGAMAYTVSTDGDVVIPISVDGLSSLDPISVGDQPVAITIHPEGTFAYVANFGSGSLSIIDIDPASSDYNGVLQTLIVGANPLDVVSTDDRVIVANAGSSNISVVDADSSSSTHHSVIATLGVGGGTKSLAVSPDGTRLYVGGDTGFIVMDLSSYGVIATLGVGGGAKSLAVTPDGTLLYVLTGPGDIVVYNVEPGSPGENSVIATLGVGGGAKSLAVSPDGALLYVVQESSDQVIVFEVSVIGGTSVIDEVSAPPYQLVFTQKDIIETGQEPAKIAFDPSGSGVAIIAQAGENEVTILNASQFPIGESLEADVDVTPTTLHLDSNGKFVTGRIELPIAYAPQEILLETVLLNDSLHVVPDKEDYEDKDGDGIEELVVKFDRADFQALLPQGEYVEVTLSGEVRDKMFSGTDTIRTIRPTVVKPFALEDIMPETAYTIVWTSPDGYTVHHADVHFSADDGVTWSPVAEGIPDAGYAAWVTPRLISVKCRIMVTLYENETDVLGMGMSQEPFGITMPVSVALQSFEIGVEEGSAVMRWKTGVEIDVTGFYLTRSQQRDGEYVRVNEELIPASGSPYGGTYQFRDEDVRPNQTYYYRLHEVAENGYGMEFGPYEVSYRVVNDLAQNVPNPFNPVTTIKFSIASDQQVRLVIYDVAGRRVRTLIDERRRADIYKVTWDGRNDHGQRVASGVYFYRLNAGKFTKTKKMMLLK